MKKLLDKKWVKTVCNLCLAFSAVIITQRISFIMYGEPEYPTEE